MAGRHRVWASGTLGQQWRRAALPPPSLSLATSHSLAGHSCPVHYLSLIHARIFQFNALKATFASLSGTPFHCPQYDSIRTIKSAIDTSERNSISSACLFAGVMSPDDSRPVGGFTLVSRHCRHICIRRSETVGPVKIFYDRPKTRFMTRA